MRSKPKVIAFVWISSVSLSAPLQLIDHARNSTLKARLK